MTSLNQIDELMDVVSHHKEHAQAVSRILDEAASQLEQSRRQTASLLKAMESAISTIEDMHLMIKYLSFDVDVTRRERDRWKKMVRDHRGL